MDESKFDINALGQVIDTTWGRSSTPKTSTYSIKAIILNEDKLQVTYQTVINFKDERDLVRAKRQCEDESVKLTNEALKHIKQSYKDLSGSTLKTKEAGTSDVVDVVARRTAVYRRKTVLEIS